MKSKLGAAFPTALRPRDRRTEPARQRTYIRLHGRVDRLEDAISHFYKVINELRRRVSTLEKKLKPLNGGGGERISPLACFSFVMLAIRTPAARMTVRRGPPVSRLTATIGMMLSFHAGGG
jgi:hypothetical protein